MKTPMTIPPVAHSTDSVLSAMEERRGLEQQPVPATPDGWGVLSYVLAGILFYGGLGWLADRWLHTSWLLPVGMVVGLVAAVYLIIKRFGGQS